MSSSGGMMTGVDAATAGGATTLILDQFADADGTALTAHAIAPTNVPGASWAANNGTWTIQGNQATSGVLGAGDYNVATADSGQADVTVTCDITTAGSGAYAPEIVGRLTDASNYWRVEIESTTQVLRIQEYNAGSGTTRASVSLTTVNGGTYALKVVFSGTGITASVGATTCNWTSSFNQTATRHGVGEFTNNGTPYNTCLFDNFKVTTP